MIKQETDLARIINIYPAIAVLPGGEGVMTFSLVGEDDYPSAAYTKAAVI